MEEIGQCISDLGVKPFSQDGIPHFLPCGIVCVIVTVLADVVIRTKVINGIMWRGILDSCFRQRKYNRGGHLFHALVFNEVVPRVNSHDDQDSLASAIEKDTKMERDQPQSELMSRLNKVFVYNHDCRDFVPQKLTSYSQCVRSFFSLAYPALIEDFS